MKLSNGTVVEYRPLKLREVKTLSREDGDPLEKMDALEAAITSIVGADGEVREFDDLDLEELQAVVEGMGEQPVPKASSSNGLPPARRTKVSGRRKS